MDLSEFRASLDYTGTGLKIRRKYTTVVMDVSPGIAV